MIFVVFVKLSLLLQMQLNISEIWVQKHKSKKESQ